MTQHPHSGADAPNQVRTHYPKTARSREINRLASRAYRARLRPPPAPVDDLPGEVWRPVVGLETKYAVSSHGRVKRLARTEYRTLTTSVDPDKLWAVHLPELLRRQHVGRNGYMHVGLKGSGKPSDTHTVHVLICEAFHGLRPDGMLATHRDDDRLHNHEGNLRWGTPKTNAEDASKNGRLKTGLESFNGKLTDDEVAIIRGSRGIIASEALGAIMGIAGGTVRILIRKRKSRPSVEPASQDEVLAFLKLAYDAGQAGAPIIARFAAQARRVTHGDHDRC